MGSGTDRRLGDRRSRHDGGVGSPLGAIFGAGIIAIIENIIVLFGVSPYWQGVVSGAIVVLAISFDALSRRYLRREGA